MSHTFLDTPLCLCRPGALRASTVPCHQAHLAELTPLPLEPLLPSNWRAPTIIFIYLLSFEICPDVFPDLSPPPPSGLGAQNIHINL